MKRFLWIACLVALVISGCSSPPVVAVSSACQANSPPADAGEVVEEGAKMQVHPRARAMPADYSGCQSVWLDVGRGPQLIGRFWYEGGRYVAYSAPQAGGPEAVLCRYRNGRLTQGDPQDCEGAEAKPIASMAPGCFALVRHSSLVNQPVPARCQAHE